MNRIFFIAVLLVWPGCSEASSGPAADTDAGASVDTQVSMDGGTADADAMGTRSPLDSGEVEDDVVSTLGGPCLSAQDCIEGTCLTGFEGGGCGYRGEAYFECNTNEDCGGEVMCHAVRDSCSYIPGGLGTRCGSPCVPDPDGPDAPEEFTRCEAELGFVCVDGACRAQTCDAGYLCDEAQRCVPPESEHPAAGYGCEWVECGSNAPCDEDQFCVMGTCFMSPGTCGMPPQPVP